jgi:hypothetical protein
LDGLERTRSFRKNKEMPLSRLYRNLGILVTIHIKGVFIVLLSVVLLFVVLLSTVIIKLIHPHCQGRIF